MNPQKIARYLLLIIFAFVSTFLVHRYVFSSHLRHGMVEDGSVSQYAGDILDRRSPLEKYSAILECDGRANGRYRPVYFVYETIPFVITAIKNGDYDFGKPVSEIKKKINGDVRLHMVYLLATIALSIFLGSLVVFKLSDSLLYAGLFPLTILFSPTLVGNITYNDTAEVPQLLGLAFYTLLFFIGEECSKKSQLKGITLAIIAVPFATIVYFTKETTIVLFPSLLLYLFCNYGAGFLIKKSTEKSRTLFFHLVHLCLNGMLTFWVLFQVHNLKGEGYSSHYGIHSIEQLWTTFQAYKRILVSFPPTISIPLAAFITILFILFFSKKTQLTEGISQRLLVVINRSIMLLSTAAGLLLLNLPWEFVGERYMLPVTYFFSLAGCVLVGALHRNSLAQKKLIQIILVFALILISYPAASTEKERIPKSYEIKFGSHRIIDTITGKIIQETRTKNGQYRVLMDVGNMSYWMWMQAARIINIEGKLNVSIPSQKFPQERMYLRRFENTPEVVIVPSDGDGYSKTYDIVFSAISFQEEKRKEKMERLKQLENTHSTRAKYTISENGENIFELIELIPEKRML
jgi:hypothetical protein